MRVIKAGREQQGWASEVGCTGAGNGGGGCGAILLVDESDLFRTSRSCYDGSNDHFSTFRCASCGVLTDVEEVPGNISRSLKPEGVDRPMESKIKRVQTRNTPIMMAVAGTSKIKINAVEAIRNRRNIHASVSGVHGSFSGVDEQPVGKPEMIRGALNRVLTAWESDPRYEVYFGIENGIALLGDSEDRWVDFAVCAMFVPEWGVFQFVESDKCQFPIEAVEATRIKGFSLHTVGKTMAEMGIVENHADPHFELCGVHRQQMLEEAIGMLFDLLPPGVFLRTPPK